ncbi:hypothetical protein ADUPG1_013823 [Aduncisulcus paluster]|uniref:mRNA capping enzyme adenylation domain-containing protein n=1 Tax=Aduncisulcus paluster TaxID=2918883 RepID=A0ABQ5K4C8_9EUKA|nr:hypothetical protein ADUPG1_013823 [Aduncisulcus paluster]
MEGIEDWIKKYQIKNAELIERIVNYVCEFGSTEEEKERKDKTFPGAQPVSFSPRALEHIISSDYHICEKTDGVRYLLFSNRLTQSFGKQVVDETTKRRCILVGRKWDIINIPLNFCGFDVGPGVLFDGELVIDTVKTAKGERKIMSYYVFDCLYFGASTLHLTLMKRLEKAMMLIHHINSFRLDVMKAGPKHKHTKLLSQLQLRMKQYYPKDQLAKLFYSVIPKLPHGNDGVIFTPALDPYKRHTCERLIKWKPMQDNTTDFAIQRWSEHVMDKDAFSIYNEEVNEQIRINEIKLKKLRQEWKEMNDSDKLLKHDLDCQMKDLRAQIDSKEFDIPTPKLQRITQYRLYLSVTGHRETGKYNLGRFSTDLSHSPIRDEILQSLSLKKIVIVECQFRPELEREEVDVVGASKVDACEVPVGSTMKKKGMWVPIRIRSDKELANNVRTYNDVCVAMRCHMDKDRLVQTLTRGLGSSQRFGRGWKGITSIGDIPSVGAGSQDVTEAEKRKMWFRLRTVRRNSLLSSQTTVISSSKQPSDISSTNISAKISSTSSDVTETRIKREREVEAKEEGQDDHEKEEQKETARDEIRRQVELKRSEKRERESAAIRKREEVISKEFNFFEQDDSSSDD